MKKTLSISWISLALLIILGHAVVPHTHHKNDLEHFCSGHEDNLDFIQAFFHPDLGADHLKNYQQSDVSIDFAIGIPSSHLWTPTVAGSVFPTFNSYPSFYQLSLSPLLRGPPLEI